MEDVDYRCPVKVQGRQAAPRRGNSTQPRAEPSVARRHPGLSGHPALSPQRVGCSKQTSKTYAFFAYSFTSFDNQIRGKVDISPFFDMAMSTCFQSFFEIEINSSDFISKMKT